MLQSSGGVQQGDPLGVLLFAAALQPLARELRAGPLDLAAFFLDDGVLAGAPASVAEALQHIDRRGREVGLQLKLSKCEVVLAGQTPATALVGFPSALTTDAAGHSRVLRDFELLGAAFGSHAYIAAHTQTRVDKASDLLAAIEELRDPQVGLRLLRSCAGHARVVHVMRCNPPSAQHAALVAFDTRTRHCFAALTGLHLNRVQWHQAGRGFAQAGLGLRLAAADAPAAYLASCGGAARACGQLDAGFDVAALTETPGVRQALVLLSTGPAAYCSGGFHQAAG